MILKDRHDAGRQLAAELLRLAPDQRERRAGHARSALHIDVTRAVESSNGLLPATRRRRRLLHAAPCSAAIAPRGYERPRAGLVSSDLAHRARCPLLVVPRGTAA